MLDTDICVELIRNKSQGLRGRLHLCKPGSVLLSSITVAELQFGVAKSHKPEQNEIALRHFLQSFDIVDFDISAAQEYGPIRNGLEKAGQKIGSMDTLIAAHALSLGVALVTNNVREFSRVTGLELESWM